MSSVAITIQTAITTAGHPTTNYWRCPIFSIYYKQNNRREKYVIC